MGSGETFKRWEECVLAVRAVLVMSVCEVFWVAIGLSLAQASRHVLPPRETCHRLVTTFLATSPLCFWMFSQLHNRPVL